MKLDRFLRIAVGLLVLLVFVIAIAAMLFVTESALNVWDRLIEGPRIILYGYVTVMSAQQSMRHDGSAMEVGIEGPLICCL